MKVISCNEAWKELVAAVEKAGGVTKFLKKHKLDHCHRSNLNGIVKARIKPQPMFLRCIGIHKVYVKDIRK